VAASTKARGEGIGFAGVGIKLGLLVSREVITETRRGATHVATRWHLASRHRVPWKWIPPAGMTASRGTAVRLTLTNQLSSLLDGGYLEETVRRHFEESMQSCGWLRPAAEGRSVVRDCGLNARCHCRKASSRVALGTWTWLGFGDQRDGPFRRSPSRGEAPAKLRPPPHNIACSQDRPVRC
jgi:hypothetical protein